MWWAGAAAGGAGGLPGAPSAGAAAPLPRKAPCLQQGWDRPECPGLLPRGGLPREKPTLLEQQLATPGTHPSVLLCRDLLVAWSLPGDQPVQEVTFAFPTYQLFP